MSEDDFLPGPEEAERVAHLDQIEKLQAFKTYVHARLDAMRIPVDPPGEHRDAGCRVGQRLDVVEARLSRLSALLEEAEAALGPFAREGTRQHKGDIEIKYLLPEDTRVLMVYQGPPHFYFDRPIMPEIAVGDLRLAASVSAKIAKEKST